MIQKMMIYGATGYTGSMIVQHALASGVPLILAGRDERKLAAMASTLNVPYRAFSLVDPEIVEEALADVAVVLNCAGPFMHTASALIKAAIAKRAHYLDVAAESDSYRLAETLDQEATAAGVMLLPGCGGSVAMLGCLAAHAVERVTTPISLSLALHVAGPISPPSCI